MTGRHATRCGLAVGAAVVFASIVAIAWSALGEEHGSGARAGAAGEVRFVKRTSPQFDRFTTRADRGFRSWMRAKFWRSVVFSPYFDSKTRWYPRGWAYFDLYAIYRDSRLAHRRPRWILRDVNGRRLYIPFDCARGTCPQYAADVGSQPFRRWWIREARRRLAQGYRGVWIDDVNLDLRVSDGDGEFVAPIDPRTGEPMTEERWRGYVAGFVEQVRRALPDAEIAHNSIWYAGGELREADPQVLRAIDAADWVNIEHGVNDPNVVGGDGDFSLNRMLAYVDAVHARGRAIVLEGSRRDPVGREYSLAAYFLVSGGRDGIGLKPINPHNWWKAYDLRLGAAEGPRYLWQGLLRRDFAAGTVLLNEPGAPTRTVRLERPMRATTGRIVEEVTLGRREGAVLDDPATPSR